MAVSINSLSVELVDLVVSHINVRDAGALRLANRAANSLVLQTRYLDSFRSRRLWLRRDSLQRFEQQTRDADPIFLPHSITLLGVLQYAMKIKEEREQHQAVLTRVFANLKKRATTRSLLSLILDVSLPDDQGIFLLEDPSVKISDWKYVWDVAQQTFTVAMGALGDAGLQVTQKLDLFTRPRSCSLRYTDFLDIPTEFPKVLKSLESLKELRASLSPPTHAPPGLRRFDLEEEFNGINPKNLLKDLAGALPIVVPAVESILMHWSDLNRRWWNEFDEPGDWSALPSMRLQRCSLQGLKVSEGQLSAFLRHTRPPVLELKYVQMFQGSWDPILAFIGSEESGVRSCVLDDLKQNHILIHFNTPGDVKYSYQDGFSWPSRLTWDRVSTREPIEHCVAPGRTALSPRFFRWNRRKIETFSISLDFVRTNSRELVEYRDLLEEEPDLLSL